MLAATLRDVLMTSLSETALTTCGVAKPSDIYKAITDLPDLKLDMIYAAAKRATEYMRAHNTLQSTFGALVEKTIATYNLFYKNGATRALRKVTKNYNYEALLANSSFARLATIGLIHSLLSKYQKDRPSQRSYLRQGVASLVSLGLAGTATLILCNKTHIFGSRQVTPLDIANDLGGILLFTIGCEVLTRSLKAVAWTISGEKDFSGVAIRLNTVRLNGLIEDTRRLEARHEKEIRALFTRLEKLEEKLSNERNEASDNASGGSDVFVKCAQLTSGYFIDNRIFFSENLSILSKRIKQCEDALSKSRRIGKNRPKVPPRKSKKFAQIRGHIL